MTETATLIAIGMGPGDPELITLKGLRALQAADVIFVPQSRDGDQSLALRIAEPWIDRARQTVVALPLPMTRDAGQLRPAWRAAAETIATELNGRRRGAYLLLGDPLLYGTFVYLAGAANVLTLTAVVPLLTGITEEEERAAVFGMNASAGLIIGLVGSGVGGCFPERQHSSWEWRQMILPPTGWRCQSWLCWVVSQRCRC